MSAATRKAAELKAKLASITSELKFWCDESEANKPFEKHHSQIRRIARPIETAAGKLAKEVEAFAQAGTILEEARRLEQLIIDLHSVWEFFRAKLLMRARDPFRKFLTIADEFAWACYEPAVLKIDPLRKEPPLTFFQSDTSPLALPRDHSYRSSVNNDRLRSDDAVALLKSLPIPVIAVPWFQSQHLPDLLIVAHEVGHHVEELGLTADLDQAVKSAGVPPAHQAAWLAWKGEVFADVYATLAAGAGFTKALVDFLLTAPAKIAGETRAAPNWTDYPTAYLRILTSCAVLRETQLKADADPIEQAWRQSFPAHAMTAWETDCTAIAKALATFGYRNGTLDLRTITDFDEVRQKNAQQSATNALQAKAIAATDVRELVAASALAFSDSPAAFHVPIQNLSPQDRLATRIEASGKSGTRSGAKHGGPPALQKTRAADEAASEDFYAGLRQLG